MLLGHPQAPSPTAGTCYKHEICNQHPAFAAFCCYPVCLTAWKALSNNKYNNNQIISKGPVAGKAGEMHHDSNVDELPLLAHTTQSKTWQTQLNNCEYDTR